jgi:hypothetical protein
MPWRWLSDDAVMTSTVSFIIQDRGVHYLSICYSERLAEAGCATSVGSRGDAYDCENLRCRLVA